MISTEEDGLYTSQDLEEEEPYTPLDPAEAIREYADSSGISENVVLELIESTVESQYYDQGLQVHASCQIEDGKFTIRVVQYITAPDGFQDYRIIEDPPPISEERFRAIVDFYLEYHSGPWHVDLARFISISDDGYYILSLTGSDKPQDCVVLPRRNVGAADLQMGETYYVAYKRFREKDIHAGIEPYFQTGVAHIGTRSDSLFLRLLFQKLHSFFQPFQAEIAMQVGMVILPPLTDLGPILGPGGQNIKLLAKIAGLERVICVIQPPADRSSRARIRYAFRHVTGVIPTGISEQPIIEDGLRYWKVTVPESKRGRVIGKNGANVILIMRLSGETVLI